MDGTVTHPIGDEFLMGYAAGLLPEAYDLMVATAVSLDDDARARLAGFEAMGGTLLAKIEVAPLRDDSFDAVMARIAQGDPAETVETRRKAPRPNAILPQPLREAVGGDVDDLRWRAVGMGVRQILIGERVEGARAADVDPGRADDPGSRP
jgi:putative transcriptional regulator